MQSQPVGQAKLTIRSVVNGISPSNLVSSDSNNITIETPRYRKFTYIVEKIIAQDGQIIEMAGNDDVMLSAISATDIHCLLAHFTCEQEQWDFLRILLEDEGLCLGAADYFI